RAKLIVEQIATVFRGDAKIAWEALPDAEKPRTWLPHQFDGIAQTIGLRQWIIDKFLGRTYRVEQYSRFNRLKMDRTRYKSMVEFNIEYNNLKREAGIKKQNRLLKEQIEAFQHKGFISRGKNKDFFTGETIDPTSETFTYIKDKTYEPKSRSKSRSRMSNANDFSRKERNYYGKNRNRS